jgi:hypothetical protein
MDNTILINTDTTIAPTACHPLGYLCDSQGDKSSKRLFGAILLGIGSVMGMTLFSYGLYNPEGSFKISFEVMNSFLLSGGSLVGLGLLENLKDVFRKS